MDPSSMKIFYFCSISSQENWKNKTSKQDLIIKKLIAKILETETISITTKICALLVLSILTSRQVMESGDRYEYKKTG